MRSPRDVGGQAVGIGTFDERQALGAGVPGARQRGTGDAVGASGPQGQIAAVQGVGGLGAIAEIADLAAHNVIQSDACRSWRSSSTTLGNCSGCSAAKDSQCFGPWRMR